MSKSALELVHQRVDKQKKRIGLKKDEHKLCLAVEGGGFIGVISMGMLMALKDLDVLKVFDVYVGCSAGSLNLAYILGDKAEEGLSVYYDHVINHRFIDTTRIVRGKYVLDMKVLELIMKEVVPLPTKELTTRHPQDFYICLTSVNPPEGRLVNVTEAGRDLQEYLLAGATIPYLGGNPRAVKGKKYLDGTFAYPDLAVAAEALGCSHVLVLSTHPDNISLNKYDNLAGKGYKQLLSRGYPQVQDLWATRLDYSKHLRSLSPDLMSSRIKSQSVAVSKTHHKVAGFNSDQWLIIDGARKGYQAIVNLFQPEAVVGLVPEIF